MKLQELRQIIREVISEELANDSYNKKAKAINEIKRIIAENEIEEIELEEIFGIGKKPATDAELDAYLAKNKALKSSLEKMDPEKAKKWREFVKVKKANRIKNDEAILNVRWNTEKSEWEEVSGPSTGRSTGFSE